MSSRDSFLEKVTGLLKSAPPGTDFLFVSKLDLSEDSSTVGFATCSESGLDGPDLAEDMAESILELLEQGVEEAESPNITKTRH